MENKCCEKCFGRQGTLAGGGIYCNFLNCPCYQSTKEILKSIKEKVLDASEIYEIESTNTEDQIDSKRNRKYFPDLDLSTNTEYKVARIECPLCGTKGAQNYIPPATIGDCFKGEWHDCKGLQAKQVSKEESWEEEVKKEARWLHCLIQLKDVEESLKSFIQEQMDKKEAHRKAELEEIISRIEKVKEEVRTQTGSFKYDDQYDDCLQIIKSKI